MLTYFLSLIAVIPLLNSAFLAIPSWRIFTNFTSKFFPILFSLILLGTYQKLGAEGFYLVIFNIFSDVSFGFLLDRTVLIFLFLLNFIWLIFAFYSSKFFQLVEFERAQNFQLFFSLNIALLALVLISKNLLTALFFYNFIIVISLFFAINFLFKKADRFSYFFIFLFYLKSLLLFLAVILTYKFIGKLEFISGFNQENISSFKLEIIVLSLYFAALFLFLITPFYLFYQRNINAEPVFSYNFFLLPYAFAGLFLFGRILNFIFGFENFGNLIDKVGFNLIEIAFFLPLSCAAVFLILSKNLKSSFFALFFQLFAFALFALLFFAKFDLTRTYLPIYVLLLEVTLIFLTFSNINLYLSKSEEKQLEGLFYKMPITCGILVFTFASMIGFAPTIGMLEKFLILKIIISQKLWLSLGILVLSSLSLLGFFVKSLRFIFLRSATEAAESENEIAKDIDFDSNLILTALPVALLAFFLFIINFFYHL